MTKGDLNHPFLQIIGWEMIFLQKIKRRWDTSSAFSFTKSLQLWGHRDNLKGSWLSRKRIIHTWEQSGIICLIQPNKADPLIFFFLPSGLHLSPWVYIHRILLTSRTWGFLQVKIVAIILNEQREALEAWSWRAQRSAGMNCWLWSRWSSTRWWGWSAASLSEQKSHHAQTFPEKDSWDTGGEKGQSLSETSTCRMTPAFLTTLRLLCSIISKHVYFLVVIMTLKVKSLQIWSNECFMT